VIVVESDTEETKVIVVEDSTGEDTIIVVTPDITADIVVISQGDNTPLVSVDGDITVPVDLGNVEDKPAIITVVDPVTDIATTVVVQD
jgi:hypothetical protein